MDNNGKTILFHLHQCGHCINAFSDGIQMVHCVNKNIITGRMQFVPYVTTHMSLQVELRWYLVLQHKRHYDRIALIPCVITQMSLMVELCRHLVLQHKCLYW